MAQESFDRVDNASSGHSSAGHAATASSAGIGFERSKYGMYFFIRSGMSAQIIKAVLSQALLFMSKDQFEQWALAIIVQFARLAR
ncbi:hypothetical protein FIBSPDRAFT_967354 [Athelia psychrophila]|uniref:Uncharacterized protein n=1 Tax=Athelia psychrophila TaxID=1759441 RepID=A0A167VTG3_9AGAM|nr:hypothetical protein FIBSPDRAFT_967354 [Fibularhizoctonia sp. CBS 109695]